MPCNCDYMNPNEWEIQLSQVACLLDEMNGIPFNRSHWRGYHPSVYMEGLSKEKADAMVESLCSKLQETNVSNYSLEMQMWWRDHQLADKTRVQKELEEKQKEEDRQRALSKLSSYERSLLGL